MLMRMTTDVYVHSNYRSLTGSWGSRSVVVCMCVSQVDFPLVHVEGPLQLPNEDAFTGAGWGDASLVCFIPEKSWIRLHNKLVKHNFPFARLRKQFSAFWQSAGAADSCSMHSRQRMDCLAELSKTILSLTT